MITDCPTAMSQAEVRLLQRWAEGKRVVEAGALLGFSTIKLADVAKEVTSIDRHEGYSGSTYRRYRSNLERSGLASRIRPLCGDALEELPTTEADFGFIDLTGQFDLTRAALLAMRPKLVAVHDFGRVHCQVGDAIRSAGFRVVEVVDTLAVCERL